jgi:iron complex outermembrane receptor protein
VGGNQWPFSPKFTGNIHASWTVASLPSGSVTLAPEVQYLSSYFYDIFDAPQLKSGGYALFNARLTYEGRSGFSASLWGKNLANKFYEPWGANTESFGANYYIRGMPRMYGVEASYRF